MTFFTIAKMRQMSIYWGKLCDWNVIANFTHFIIYSLLGGKMD